MNSVERSVRRRKSRFEIWAWSPVIVLRVALVITYMLYVYSSVIAFMAGIPVFSLVAWEGYTPIWAVVLGASAVASAVGAISDDWQRIEKWSSLVLTSMLIGYVGGLNLVGFLEGDLTRQFVGVIALIALVLPATRFAWLAAQSGKVPADG